MKKRNLFIVVSIAVISIIIIFAVMYIKSQKNYSLQASPTSEITSEIVVRLHSYPYYQNEPNLTFEQVIEQRPNLAKQIVDDFYSSFDIFEKNEKFISNEKLVYVTANNHYVIRGILQTVLKNGDVTEQDVEYQYYYGGFDGPKNIFEEMRRLDEKKVIKGSD